MLFMLGCWVFHEELRLSLLPPLVSVGRKAYFFFRKGSSLARTKLLEGERNKSFSPFSGKKTGEKGRRSRRRPWQKFFPASFLPFPLRENSGRRMIDGLACLPPPPPSFPPSPFPPASCQRIDRVGIKCQTHFEGLVVGGELKLVTFVPVTRDRNSFCAACGRHFLLFCALKKWRPERDFPADKVPSKENRISSLSFLGLF